MQPILVVRLIVFVLLLAACGAGTPTGPESSRASERGDIQPPFARPTTAPIIEPLLTAKATPFANTSPAPHPTVIVAGVADAPAVVQLITHLRQRGLEPQAVGVSRAAFQPDALGQSYQLGTGWLHLHLFPSAEAARAKTADIQRELAHPTADPVAPPHAFRCDQLIALYLGTDAQVTSALTELCGAQIAGGT